MVTCSKEIRGFRLRVGRIVAIGYGLRLCLAWTMIWAFLVVLLRVACGVDRQHLALGLLGYLPAAAAAMLLAVRRIPPRHVLQAALDCHGRLGGLLMAAGECDIGSWSGRTAVVSVPAVRLRAGRQGVLLPAGILFLTAAFLIPNRYLPAAGAARLEVGAPMAQLAEKLQLLKQERLMPVEKVQSLEKDLERIRQEASASQPAKTMEAIDHLQQSLDKSAAEAAESAIQQAQKASRAQGLAEALQKAQGRLDPKQLGEAMKDLARMADQAAAESKLLAENTDQSLLESCRQGNLTPEQLKELALALAKCKEGERLQIEKLVKARLVDATELERIIGVCEDPEGDLLAALGECKDGDELAALLDGLDGTSGQDGPDGDGLPGRGGRNRGRGDAAMTWTEGTEKGNAAFKEKLLPPAAVASLKQSRLVGMSRSDPTAAKPAGGSSGGALANARAGSGTARTQVILPEHERAVRRYFDRQKQ